MSRFHFAVALGLALAWRAAVVHAADGPDEPAEQTPTPSATHTVRRERFKIEVQLDGVFEAVRQNEVVLRPKVWTSLVVERAVAHGARVRKGQQLVWLDLAKLDEQLRDKEHALQISQLSLRDSEAEFEQLQAINPLDRKAAERANRLAQEDLEYFLEVQKPRLLEDTRRSLQSAQWQLEYAQEELDQLEKMYEADDLTEETEEIILKRARRDVETRTYALETARIRHDRTLQRDVPRQTIDATEAAERQQLDWQRTRITLATALQRKESELEKLRQQHRKLATDLARLKQDRQALTVRAPADGIVYYGRCQRGKWPDVAKVTEKLQPGGTLTVNQPILAVVDLRPLNIRVDLPEGQLQHVRRGLSAEVTPGGFPELQLSSRVTGLSTIPIAPSQFDCQLRVADKPDDPRIVPGMTCRVRIVAYDREQAITVPPAALSQDDAGKDCVFVVQPDDTVQQRPVVVGKRTSDKVEILRGLKAGEQVRLDKPQKG